jgi:hypothetical protein
VTAGRGGDASGGTVAGNVNGDDGHDADGGVYTVAYEIIGCSTSHCSDPELSMGGQPLYVKGIDWVLALAPMVVIAVDWFRGDNRIAVQ